MVRLYRSAAHEAGHDPAQLPIGVNTPLYIADTSQRAADESFGPFVKMMNRIGRERGWGPMSCARIVPRSTHVGRRLCRRQSLSH